LLLTRFVKKCSTLFNIHGKSRKWSSIQKKLRFPPRFIEALIIMMIQKQVNGVEMSVSLIRRKKNIFLVQKNIVTTYLVLVSYALRFSWKMKHYAKLNNSTVVEFEIYKPICFRFCFKAMSFKLANNLFNEYGFVLHIKTRLSDVVCLMTLKLKSTRLLLYVNLKLLKIVYSNNLF
jgi:hypothetical protein